MLSLRTQDVVSKELRLWASPLNALTVCSQSLSMKVITEKASAKKTKKSVFMRVNEINESLFRSLICISLIFFLFSLCFKEHGAVSSLQFLVFLIYQILT